MTEEMRLGLSGLAGLAQQVQRDWLQGGGADAEAIERCDCCGELLGYVDPQEREMVEQWTSFQTREPSSIGEGCADTGWPAEMRGEWFDFSRGELGWGGAMRFDDGIDLI